MHGGSRPCRPHERIRSARHRYALEPCVGFSCEQARAVMERNVYNEVGEHAGQNRLSLLRVGRHIDLVARSSSSSASSLRSIGLSSMMRIRPGIEFSVYTRTLSGKASIVAGYTRSAARADRHRFSGKSRSPASRARRRSRRCSAPARRRGSGQRPPESAHRRRCRTPRRPPPRCSRRRSPAPRAPAADRRPRIAHAPHRAHHASKENDSNTIAPACHPA